VSLSLHSEALDRHKHRFTLLQDGQPLLRGGLAARLRSSARARLLISRAIVSCPWPAVFWECAPLDPSTRRLPAEFVVVDAPSLARVQADPRPFARHLASGGLATFHSLGRDAVLVAPSPQEGARSAHLAGWLRSVPETSMHELWRAVGAAMGSWPAQRSLWLSTSGLGVYWLHIRLDSRPKYYTHRPYRRLAPETA